MMQNNSHSGPAPGRFRIVLAAIALSLATTLATIGTVLGVTRPPFIVLVLSIGLGSFAEGVTILLSAATVLAVVAHVLAHGRSAGIARISAIAAAVCVLVIIGITVRARSAYRTEDVAFKSGDITLAGTLYRPRGDGPMPGVVIVAGSGNKGRQVYHMLSDRIARAGFIVLNPDKRGVGESGGSYETIGEQNEDPTASFEQRAIDVVEAVDYLATVKGVRADRVGLWAVSQGGWITPMALQKSSTPAFAVIVSGPAVSTGAEDLYSRLLGDEADHFGYKPPPMPIAAADDSVARMSPSGFDPIEYMRRMHAPTLWMYGEWDNSVPVSASVARLDTLAQLGAPITTRVFPEANHGLMVARGPHKRMLPYFAPDVWTTMLTWMHEKAQ